MKRRFSYYICIALLAFVLLPNPSFGEDVVLVSMINLIATPEKYEGKSIRVVGYAVIEKDKCIFLSEEDARKKITKNAVWIDIGKLQVQYRLLNRKYVLVEGIFNYKNKGDMSMLSGTIKNISRLEEW